jgi:polyphosphate kinase 2 (PPK2 family)
MGPKNPAPIRSAARRATGTSVPHSPVPQEVVLFNRSWYNRAGVERVMGFCTDTEYGEFMETLAHFEQMLVHSGIRLFKYYLDISRFEQKERLQDRRRDPSGVLEFAPACLKKGLNAE